MTDEAEEGKNAFLEKRKPDWSKFGRSPSLVNYYSP
jgi:naphthoate synthase